MYLVATHICSLLHHGERGILLTYYTGIRILSTSKHEALTHILKIESGGKSVSFHDFISSMLVVTS